MSRVVSAWKRCRKWLATAFFIAVAVLLFTQAREVDWHQVTTSIRRTDPFLLAGALAMAGASYLLYASYDLMGQRYTGHRLSAARTVAIAMVSYAFNLNMGALIGGAGFRFRLYSRFGLGPATITRILTFSVISNWMGYVLLAGLLLATNRMPLSLQWDLGSHAMRGIGLLLLAGVAAYLMACAFSTRRQLTIRSHEIELPTLRMALLQTTLSSANWLTIATIVHVLLPSGPEYTAVLAVLLAAAVAGALTHVPAGLGVLEAVFVLALGPRLGTPAILAALLTYRAIYYLIPLLLALPAYLLLERIAARTGASDNASERG